SHIHTLLPQDAPLLLLEQLQVQRIGEVIFCAKDLNFDDIMQLVSLLRKTGAESKIILPGTDIRVGYRF
ncbi:MAG: hypothetical protein K2O66_03415, partial [Bacteroidales bacterium]|nr:hypothetical protein [Bacteroidales bacterium]